MSADRVSAVARSIQKQTRTLFFIRSIFPGTVVLAHESGDGDTEGAADHPVEGIDLSESGPGGHCVRSEGVQGGLDYHVGDVVHGGLKAGRKADLQQHGEGRCVKADLAELQPVNIFGPHQIPEDQNGA